MIVIIIIISMIVGVITGRYLTFKNLNKKRYFRYKGSYYEIFEMEE